MNIAQGELATMPASRDELEALNVILWERLRDAERERDALRAWGDKMPVRSITLIANLILANPQWITAKDAALLNEWAMSRPQFPAP